MPVDSNAAQLLESMAAAMPPIETLTPSEARTAAAKLAALLPTTPPASQVSERSVAVEGGEVRVRIYRPAITGTLPVFLYIHGGGWVIGGDIEIYDPLCDRLANEAECVVISVGYRLAPEFPFPIPLEDCFAAACWVTSSAADLDIDPERLAIGGDSSGGNLAAALALVCRDRGGPAVCFQLLVYPPVVCRRHGEEYAEELAVAVLSGAGMAWYWNHYLPNEADGSDRYASPLLAKDLTGLPPALVISAEYDVLRDEVRAFASRLQKASVPVVHRHYADMFHGFFGFSSVLPQADNALTEAATDLHRVLHP
jgi:acetyl esterase